MSHHPGVIRLDWDEWNLAHITKHRVRPDEAEEVVQGNPIFSDSYKNRSIMIGPTYAGRMLTIIIGSVPQQPGVYYVFSARSCSRQELRKYEEQRGGSSS